MRTVILVALLLAGGAVLAPAPVASAHTCEFFNAPCLAVCLAHAFIAGHPCNVYAPEWPIEPLP